MPLYNTEQEIRDAIKPNGLIEGIVEINFREIFFCNDMNDKWDMLCDALVERNWGLYLTDVYFEFMGRNGRNAKILAYGNTKDLLEEFEISKIT